MNKLALPTKKASTMRIVGFKSVTAETNGKFKNDSVIITGEDQDKNHIVLVMNQAMVNSFEKSHVLFEGNMVNFHYEECIADTTQYTDLNGDVQFHLFDHLRVEDFFPASDEDITNFLFKGAVRASFDALKDIMVGVDVGDLAKIATDTAKTSIRESIDRLTARRAEHVRVASSVPQKPKSGRKDVLTAQIADIDARIGTATPALKPTLESKKARLEAELAEL